MAHVVLARDRFIATRAAVQRLEDVKTVIMFEGEDWKPTQPKAKGMSDPTARKAIYRADELSQVLDNLYKEEHDLEVFIGTTLAIIEAVRNGLGAKFAIVLEARYIDGWQWSQVDEEYGIKRQYGNYLQNIAFDWIDSIGIRELLRGECEL